MKVYKIETKIEKPTLHEIPQLDEESLVVFERANPVTLSAEERAGVVTRLNFLLDEIYILQTTVENILLTVDREG